VNISSIDETRSTPHCSRSVSEATSSPTMEPVWEVAAAGRPALLVPYPHATADHQAKNAAYFERGGGAVVVAEGELDLRRQVDALLADPQRLEAMAAAMLRLAKPDAADVVAEELMALAGA
jgi:UDP-N-acetylglucosamine--N-acetylmuramyl-(pentapeptide) pyrophosphoryl-undecaprenol N-acetylglucosamine transferase